MPRRQRPGGAFVLAACLALALPVASASAAPGDLDGAFATSGVHTASFMTTLPGQEDSHKVAIDSQGRVVVAATLEGQLSGGLPRAIKVFRLTAQGQPDPGFAGGGEVTLPVAGDTYLGGLVIDAQDRPIIAGTSGDLTSSQIALVRLTTAGAPDPSFSGDGQSVAPLPALIAGPQVSGLAIDAAGGLLASGIAYSGGGVRTFFVARYSSGGDLDTSYGAGGWRQIGASAAGARELSGIAALPGGGAFVAGFDGTWFVTRLTAGGAFDATFDGDGTATSDLGKGALDTASDFGLTVDGSGRPIVVGQLVASGNARWVLARWTSAGAADATFGTGAPAPGVVLGPANHTRLNDVDVQRDGKLVVTGIALRPDLTDNALAIARYTAAGALDPTFAPAAPTPGIVRLSVGDRAVGSDLALAPGSATAVGVRRATTQTVQAGSLKDLPIVTRVLRDDAGADVPGSPAPVVPASPAAAATPSRPSSAALPSFASLATLPGTKACVSRRRFSIRLRVPQDSSVTSAEVKVNGRSVAVRRGARLRSVVNLTKLPKGRFRVQITMRLADGRTVKGTRTYRTCAVKRRAGSGPRV